MLCNLGRKPYVSFPTNVFVFENSLLFVSDFLIDMDLIMICCAYRNKYIKKIIYDIFLKVSLFV